VIGILEFNSFLAGTGYPTGKNTRAGTGMGKILYPRVYMGNPTGRIFFDGYGYGMVLPDGYVPVAIPTHASLREQAGRWDQVEETAPANCWLAHSRRRRGLPLSSFTGERDKTTYSFRHRSRMPRHGFQIATVLVLSISDTLNGYR
jgi:hypothetical protein